jgi:hypothetical protein
LNFGSGGKHSLITRKESTPSAHSTVNATETLGVRLKHMALILAVADKDLTEQLTTKKEN